MKITIGNLIDQLTVANIRIWMAEDIKRNPDASDKEIADATRITNVVNQQRNDLIQAIDESLNEMVVKGETQKIYKQGFTKIYGKK
jgi:ABC-type amino acid transport substrate-binding protein